MRIQCGILVFAVTVGLALFLFLPHLGIFAATPIALGLPVVIGVLLCGVIEMAQNADIKELALYVEDQITKGNWLFNVGIRGDLYNGLTVARSLSGKLE